MSKKEKDFFDKKIDETFNDALFSCRNIANMEELIKALKPYPRLYYSYEIRMSIFFSIIAIIVGNIYDFSFIEIICFILFLTFLIFSLHNVTFPKIAKVIYPSYVKNEIRDVYIFDSFIIFRHDTKILKFEYTGLEKIVETSDTFYIIFSDDIEIRVIPKESCSCDCMNFIRSINKDVYKYKESL